MAGPSRFVYEALVTPSMTTLMQKRVMAYAERHKDIPLMLSLAGLPTLDPEIEAALADRGEAEVLLAWALRPGRTTEQLLARFRKEKRATLLAQLAERPDLPAVLYEELGNHGSVMVAEALVVNDAAPLEVRKKAAGPALRKIRVSYSATSNVKSLFSGVPSGVVEAAIPAAKTHVHLEGLVGLVDPQAHAKLADQFVALLSEDDGSWMSSHAANRVWESLVDSSIRKYIQDQVKQQIANGKIAAAWTSYAIDLTKRSVVDPVSEAISKLSDHSLAAPELTAAFTVVVNQGRYQRLREALPAAVRNPNLPVSVLLPHAQRCEQEELTALFRRVSDDYDMVLQLVAQVGAGGFDTALAEGVNGEQLLADLKARTGDVPHWVLYSGFIESRPTLALSLFNVKTALTSQVTAELSRKTISDRLGDDDRRWEMFERLANEWTGTLPELLDAATTL